MSRTKIAAIQLVNGVVSWYDDDNYIYLTSFNRKADIYSDMYMATINEGVRSKYIEVIEGQLPKDINGCGFDSTLYFTKEETKKLVAENAGSVDLSTYALKSQIPTKTSQLTNDSKFLTSIPTEYVTETELNSKGYLTQHQSLANYALKSEIPSLTNYALKSQVPTKTSQLTNDSKFLTSIPVEYVTEDKLNSKGYLTQHQSLDAYATKAYVGEEISKIELTPGPKGNGVKSAELRDNALYLILDDNSEINCGTITVPSV